MKNITAAIIGANGFLGLALTEKLIENNIQVIAVYNTNKENIRQELEKLTTIQFLHSDKKIDFIYYVSGNYANSKEELLQINDYLYHCTLKFKTSKFIYISSTNVYGNYDGTIRKDSPFNNPSQYGLSKISGEFIVSGVENYAIIRPTYIYGKGISNKSFIPFLIKNASENGSITLYGKGERMQDYIYIDDIVELCYLASLKNENAIYLGISGTSHTNLEVAQEVSKHLPSNIEFKGEETGTSFIFSTENAYNNLKWKPKMSLAEGITKMLA